MESLSIQAVKYLYDAPVDEVKFFDGFISYFSVNKKSKGEQLLLIALNLITL